MVKSNFSCACWSSGRAFLGLSPTQGPCGAGPAQPHTLQDAGDEMGIGVGQSPSALCQGQNSRL